MLENRRTLESLRDGVGALFPRLPSSTFITGCTPTTIRLTTTRGKYCAWFGGEPRCFIIARRCGFVALEVHVNTKVTSVNEAR